ncbi:hypothetical protein [Flavobacterium psychrophilum]|uniref:hypothetical protein n=4 Tax=Flavobacterium psychrophilum TaxID=96345 RepID=UPI00076EAB64|nr:hypothetical protein [Flavobacterium psychrophilum]SNA81983.1 conserved membrane hypothetical protein [Flavobacterium psychrophilum]SNB97829.1 conserved membrane hypothetical protein [Flavobacterium psychrophilum]GAQ48388.1 hypothetical protein FPK15_contig00009-0052 [Flavobacterium psychrophilum]GEJ30385.1 hypothetical protein FPN185_contig00045-0010 [Flavobacterium psychrophilum]GEJ30445.1 hypothetical protein FPN181_contig00046-0048 [Flavobacterium psychrophilum]
MFCTTNKTTNQKMINNDINDLLEINPEKRINQKNQNIVKHVLIRAGVAVLSLLIIVLYLDRCDLGMYGFLALFYIMGSFLLLWIIFLLIEALILHNNKKPLLRNANLIMILTLVILVFGALNTLS